MEKFLKVNDRVNVYYKSEKSNYKATIWEVTSSGFVINQPQSKNGRLHLPKGSNWEINVETQDALYYFTSKVLKPMKGSTPLYLMELPKSVRRQQRREFFRLPCNLEVEFMVIEEGEEKKEEEKHDEKLVEITEDNDLFAKVNAFYEKSESIKTEEDTVNTIAVDISGGGIQLVSSDDINPGTILLIIINIPGIKGGVKVKGKVVRAFPIKVKAYLTYRVAVSFHDIDEKTRDIIIKYIFDQSRKRVKDI